MARRGYSNVASTLTTNSSLSNATTTDTCTVTATPTGWPASYPFFAVIDPGTASEELISVTNITGTTLSFTRGGSLTTPYGSTTKAHTTGAIIKHVSSAADFDEANAHVNASAAVHGLTGTVVGTSDAQTLTNKTLTTAGNPGVALNQSQTHGTPDTDAATSSLHHTIGTGATQAAAGNHTHGGTGLNGLVLFESYTPVASTNGYGLAAAVGTATATLAGGVNLLQSGATAGSSYAFMKSVNGNEYTSFSALHPNLDLSLRINIAAGSATSLLYFGIADGNGLASTVGNGFWAQVNLNTGVVSAYARVASTPTTTATTGTVPVGTAPFHDLRIVYPVAGGTATLYLDGASIGTVTVPSVAGATRTPMSISFTNGAAGSCTFYILRSVITES